MKNINMKKLIPGIISIVVVIGMALQSFATDIDMESFVRRDLHRQTYYELDWLIDDIEKSIERLYKWTCTNVVSFGGQGNYVNGTTISYQRASTQTYHWNMDPITDLSEEGYLRFNPADAINAFGNHSKADVYEAELPASLALWRSEVELYPTTKIKAKLTRVWPNTTSASQSATWTQEIIMGPFKKFPNISTLTTQASTFCSVTKFFPLSLDMASVSYRYGTDTEPTSWASMTGSLTVLQTDKNTQSYTTIPRELLRGVTTQADIEDNFYRGDKSKISTTACYFYANTTWGTNLSNYDKVWIRAVGTVSGTYEHKIDGWTLTSWNNK